MVTTALDLLGGEDAMGTEHDDRHEIIGKNFYCGAVYGVNVF